MNIGLVGLPMSGKTTLFNIVTRSQAQVKGYLAKSDEINFGVISVPDDRIDYLSKVFEPNKIIYASVEFVDIPGVNKEDGSNTGFSSKTLSNIRASDALGLVVRLHADTNVPHLRNKVDPESDMEELSVEFILSDLEIVENKIERIHRDQKSGSKPELARELELMQQIKQTLEQNKFISTLSFTPEETLFLRGFRFLTQKPILAFGNVSDSQLTAPSEPMVQAFFRHCQKNSWIGILISAKTEMEIAGLSADEELAFLQEFGISESSRNRVIREAYSILNYISFLTVGKDEVRAWPIQNGTKAQRAAGGVHSDIERGFIRAEVIAYNDFVAKNGMAGAKQAGLVRLEGKDYIVEDGDIINFRFHV